MVTGERGEFGSTDRNSQERQAGEVLPAETGLTAAAVPDEGAAASEPASLPVDPVVFWTAPAGLENLTFTIASPEAPLSLLKQLGEPLWYKGKPGFLALMGQYYQEVTRRALETAFAAGSEPGQRADFD